jgi:ABC-type antimicrobial peptide transport system permease subunit
VSGISAGTNAFVVQYGFTTLRSAQRLLGYPNVVTGYLISVRQGYAPENVANAIREDLPGVEVYNRGTFLANNIHEMESGFLPILYAIAAIGAVVLTSILTLLLTVIILESRKDFAIMRAVGSPDRFLRGVVFSQAFILSSTGTAVALLIFSPFSSVIEWLTPEISISASAWQNAAVAAVVCGITTFSAWIAMRRLRGIYPLEAFA